MVDVLVPVTGEATLDDRRFFASMQQATPAERVRHGADSVIAWRGEGVRPSAGALIGFAGGSYEIVAVQNGLVAGVLVAWCRRKSKCRTRRTS